jgi:hypothetical protein
VLFAAASKTNLAKMPLRPLAELTAAVSKIHGLFRPGDARFNVLSSTEEIGIGLAGRRSAEDVNEKFEPVCSDPRTVLARMFIGNPIASYVRRGTKFFESVAE